MDCWIRIGIYSSLMKLTKALILPEPMPLLMQLNANTLHLSGTPLKHWQTKNSPKKPFTIGLPDEQKSNTLSWKKAKQDNIPICGLKTLYLSHLANDNTRSQWRHRDWWRNPDYAFDLNEFSERKTKIRSGKWCERVFEKSKLPMKISFSKLRAGIRFGMWATR